MMSRSFKKCLVAAAGLHLLLMLLLFIGPAFTRQPKVENVQLLTFIPLNLTDAPTQGGTPASQPPPQEPAPAPPPREPTIVREPPQVRPEPVKPPQVVRQPTPTPKPTPPPVKPPPKVNLNPVIRDPNATQAAQEKARQEAERKAAEAERKAREALKNTTSRIEKNTAKATSVEIGGGGPALANYAAFVKRRYTDAWAVPENVADAFTVYAQVTIARDGSVIMARTSIQRRSGHGLLDQSVQNVLDRVKSIGKPFPEGANEDSRTFQLEFRPTAK